MIRPALGVLLLWLTGLTAVPAAAQALNPPDNWTPAFPSASARRAADLASWGTALVPVILDAKSSWDAPDRGKALLLQGTRISVTYGVGFLVKHLTHRDRPCVNNGCGTDDPNGSFYSLHTALPFTAVGGPRLSFVVPFGVTTGGLRIGAGKHWFTDTLIGSLAGALASRIR